MNTDKIQTILGAGEAVLVGAATYYTSLGPDGLNYKSPVFWAGMILAISRAVKGYYAAGTKSTDTVQPLPGEVKP